MFFARERHAILFFLFPGRIPSPPPDGRYTLLNGIEYVAGQAVPDLTVIKVNCKNNFVDKYNDTRRICLEGNWIPEYEEYCVGTYVNRDVREVHFLKTILDLIVATCPPLTPPPNATYRLRCTLYGREVDCSEPREGTLAEVECDAFHDRRSRRPVVPSCRDGTWDEGIDGCVPGQLFVHSTS